MCGVGKRTCAICANGSGCLAAMQDDFFIPASAEQLEQRIQNGEHKKDIKLMVETLMVLREAHNGE